MSNTFHATVEVRPSYFQRLSGEMLPTSDISFISSAHGRERRSERDIAVRDLQAAVKYGVKEPGFPNKLGELRWKYTYGDVVYITDSTSRKEITSWATEMPLSRVEIPERYATSHREAETRILRDPSIITSHTVLLVDMSGSMNKSDMNGHRTRARGAYYNIAMELVGAKLHPISSATIGGPSVSFTDVISLVEMRNEEKIVFEQRPVSWLLFNDFVALAESKEARDHGNYYPSLKAALTLLKESSKNSALALFFFSDGQPSDFATSQNESRDEVLGKILTEVITSCSCLAGRLTFAAFGFGKSASEFTIMKGIIRVAEMSGAKATFGYSYDDDNVLRNILTSTSASVTAMRSLMSCLDTGSGSRKLRSGIEKADYNPVAVFNSIEWTYFNCVKTKLTFVKKYKLEHIQNKLTGKYLPEFVEVPMLLNSVGIAVGKKYFGEGAERLVFLMSEINMDGEFIGPPLVAKASRHEQIPNLDSLRKWHKTFMRTQMRAAIYATKFNRQLDNKHVSKDIPRIEFLPCFIYECQTDSSNGQEIFAYLSEKRLDPNNYKKWNNNNGGVDGQVKHNLVNYDETMNPIVQSNQLNDFQTIKEHNLNCLDEEDEDEGVDDENEDDDTQVHGDAKIVEKDGNANAPFKASDYILALEAKILECDIPQAFTHFTHKISKRNEMVCDIQGVLNVTDGQSIFELTDPCIHSVKQKFGRTDKADDGFQDFHKTHQCNSACVLLGIANKSHR